MGEVFRGWRRKWGVAVLALALAFAGGWVRSFVVEDFIDFPFVDSSDEGSLSGLATEEQMLVLYAFSKDTDLDLEPDPTGVPLTNVVAANSDPEPEPMANALSDAEKPAAPTHADGSREFEPADALFPATPSESAGDEWITIGGSGSVRTFRIVSSCFSGRSQTPLVRIPFWSIVIPLTLLAAWLLLWKPCSSA